MDSNEHEYVDLGLHSGTLWAAKNVGAENETDCGLFFSWGENIGYNLKQIKEKEKMFSWEDYKFGSPDSILKYNKLDARKLLDLRDDMAHINMGGNWYTPLKEQFEELLKNTTKSFVENYNNSGINGVLMISSINDNHIFFPIYGIFSCGKLIEDKYRGMYWSSNILNLNLNYASYALCLKKNDIGVYGNFRSLGFNVRGVINSD